MSTNITGDLPDSDASMPDPYQSGPGQERLSAGRRNQRNQNARFSCTVAGSSSGSDPDLSEPDPECVGEGAAVPAGPFRPAGGPNSTSRVLAELARLWDQAAVHSPGQVAQKNLALASGLPYSTVNGWATGATAPRDLDQLIRPARPWPGGRKSLSLQCAHGAS